MDEQLLSLVLTALGTSVVTSGIVEVIKKNTNVEGIWTILLAIFVGVSLFVAIALVYNYPLAESVLGGVLSGLASIGAFEGVKNVKKEVE